MQKIINVPTNYYQHFDADFSLDVPAEGYGGWKKAELKMDLEHTAVVVMHAWDNGTREQYPGWHRAVEYIPRAYEIGRTVFPELLGTIRESGMKLYHVVGSGDYYKDYPGYKRATELAGSDTEPIKRIPTDPVYDELVRFKEGNSFPGKHNEEDIKQGFENINFMKWAEPLDEEGIAEDGNQLFSLCEKDNVNHLIYAGFAIDGCLLLSPGGMYEMQKRGFMCSALRQAVTAIENKETARAELCKEIGLWRVALLFGFVYDVDDFIGAISSASNKNR